MRRNIVETVMGGVVLIVAALFLVFAYTYTGESMRAGDSYEMWGKFDRVDGLQTGADVKIGGITVGTVLEQRLDTKTYLAVVRWTVDSDIQLTTDTVAEVASEGLLGGKYLALVPGGEENFIKPGGEVKFTQAPFGLEQIIGQFLFSKPQADE
ncbi:MAG: outer membrane lipid asymmetry maintenance protein MlaD [Pseudomonadota bacterium]